MSNFIPMVSSSPPPLEDGGGFNDWNDDDDDDFGTFASATNGPDFQAFNSNQWTSIPDMPPVPQNSDFGKFTDFSNFPINAKNLQNGETIQEAMNHEETLAKDSMESDVKDDIPITRSSSLKLPLHAVTDGVEETLSSSCDDNDVLCDLQETKMHKSQSDNLDSFSSVISAGDSGLCSTDISPVPHSEENLEPGDKSQESDLDDFGDFHSDSSIGREALAGSIESVGKMEEQVENDVIDNSNDSNERKNIDICDRNEDIEKIVCSNIQMSNEQEFEPDSESDQVEEFRTTSIDITCNSVSEQTSAECVAVSRVCEESSQHDNQSSMSNDSWTDDHSSKEDLYSDTVDKRPDVIENTTSVQDQYQIGTRDLDNTSESKDFVSDDEGPAHFSDDERTEIIHISHIHGEDDSSNIGYTSNDVSENLVKNESQLENIPVDLSDSRHLEGLANDFGESDKVNTFQVEAEEQTDLERSELPREMKDSGFVFAESSSSGDECEGKSVQETEAKLTENCDIPEQAVDNNDERDINENNEEHSCNVSGSSGSREVGETEENCSNDCQSEKPGCIEEPISGDDFSQFTDFNSTSGLNTVTEAGIDSEPDCIPSDDRLSRQGTDENKPIVEEIYDDNEFDDFADFHSSTPVESDSQTSESLPQASSDVNENSNRLHPNSGKCEENDNDIDDDFDSFAAFDSAEPKENNSGTNVTADDKAGWGGSGAFPAASAADSDDDWATFQARPTPDQVGTGSDDDEDFGNFEDFEQADTVNQGSPPSSTKGWAAFSPPEPVKSLVKPTSDFVITNCFPGLDGMDQKDDTPSLLDGCLQGDTTPRDNGTSGTLIWRKLKSRDGTVELSKLWSESHSNGRLFTTLRIDTRNILLGHRKPSVPVYAANLTLLEPTKGPTPPSETKTDVNKLVDTSKADDKPTKNQDFPPVQFDWTSSGLTNPLEGCDIAAEIANSKSLELDFLVVKEAEAVAKMGVFDSELMHGLRDHKAAMRPLENILATLKTSSTIRQVRPAENLTPEATKVITSLPSLSFMQAKVLMFPFKQGSDVS